MTDEILLRYGEFVNRDTELKRFCSIVDEDEFIVMVIHGEKGIGKTSLLKRLIYECREVRKMRWAETYFVDATRSYNYITVMRSIRDTIGPEFFQSFTDLLNYFTKPDYNLRINLEGPEVKMMEGADLNNVSIKEMTGHKVEIHDLNLNTPREDKMIREEERMHRLTRQFLQDLTAAFVNERIAVMIDDIEQMPPETQSWLWNELVRGVFDQDLKNIRFVFCIADEPKLDEFLKRRVRSGPLKVLSEKYVIEYLVKRKVGNEVERQTIAEMIMAVAQGNPLGMTNMVNAFLDRKRSQEEQADD